MKIRIGRAAIAGLASIALVGVGISAASAADTIPSNSKFGGTLYLASADTELAITTPTLAWNSQVVAQVAPDDANTAIPAPADATGYKYFLVQQGHEYDMSWYAASSTATFSGSMVEPNLTPTGLINAAGANAPVAGQAGVKAAGGLYSLGLVYTKNSGVTIVDGGVYFLHINIAPGGVYSFSQVETAKTATTTTLTVPATAPAENVAFSLSATVAPAAATGTVQFKDGATNLGSPVALASGAATLNVAAGLAGGSHSITAVYSGDSAYSASTSAASVITIAGTPVSTSIVVTAASATGKANQPATYTAAVTPSGATGSVDFSALKAGESTPIALGNAPVVSGTATLSSNGLGAGDWTITGVFTGTGVYQTSTDSTDAVLTLAANADPATPDDQTVTVKVDKGALKITTPWTPTHKLDLGTLELNQADSTLQMAAPVEFASATDIANGIKIENSRVDVPTFTAQVESTDFTSAGGTFDAEYAGLIHLAAHQVASNSLLASNVVPTDVPVLTNAPQTFATYAPAPVAPALTAPLGTAWLSGDIYIHGVPTSTPSGQYTATVTFTAF